MITSTEIFILIVMHCIGDWTFQDPLILKNKKTIPLYMIIHCIIWTGLICFTVSFFKIITIYNILFLFFGHYLIDTYNIFFIKNYNLNPEGFILTVDQCLHLIQILIVLIA